MGYRIAYASQADAARRALPAQRRTALDKAMRTTIGADPYGHGSVEAKPGERDYREATIAGADAIVVYYVSTPDVLTVTAVKLITA
ncbi:hypothetical protein GT204_28375 [Streptomyces sp. SID4919]|uniref:hypothetical protein n=1 Tax=unclassified Streptomyces TaxID=2593676 RepID=UPI0008239B68|nr:MULTISPECIES: hypothetical protein [unclassified Streptomyces]MYY12704.1 hypothetical protein [Streptomyces sp. SID4919]SCK20688.1 hypothetical protein YW7DRAFT_01509 [Streptomyces sp. AmelKG-E11A]